VLLVSGQDYGACSERLRFSGARGFLLKSSLASADLSVYWPIP
jgi:hypothetical protein